MAQQLQSISHVALHLRFDWRVVTVLSILDESSWFESYDHLILYVLCGLPSLLLFFFLANSVVVQLICSVFSPFMPFSKLFYIFSVKFSIRGPGIMRVNSLGTDITRYSACPALFSLALSSASFDHPKTSLVRVTAPPDAVKLDTSHIPYM